LRRNERGLRYLLLVTADVYDGDCVVCVQSELADVRERLAVASMSSGEATKKYEDMINALEGENGVLKSSLSETKSALSRESEKLVSLQNTLRNLESGHEDRIRQEQHAAEERARLLQKMEMDHIAEVREIENKLAENKVQFKVCGA
jgi:predicted RNase H-like nuclease (RuvC/YqgF family)